VQHSHTGATGCWHVKAPGTCEIVSVKRLSVMQREGEGNTQEYRQGTRHPQRSGSCCWRKGYISLSSDNGSSHSSHFASAKFHIRSSHRRGSSSPRPPKSPMVIRIPTAPASLATPLQAAHRICTDFVAIVTVIAITPATPATRYCCLHCQ